MHELNDLTAEEMETLEAALHGDSLQAIAGLDDVGNMTQLAQTEQRQILAAIASAGVRLYFSRMKSQLGTQLLQLEDPQAGGLLSALESIDRKVTDLPHSLRMSDPFASVVNAAERILGDLENGRISRPRATGLLAGVLKIDGVHVQKMVEDAAGLADQRQAAKNALKRYVVGFVFDDMRRGDAQAMPTSVLLVLKAKPRWQQGRYNGPGGSIEEGETDAEAVAREVREESNDVVKIAPEAWRRFATLEGPEVYNPPKGPADGVAPGFQIEMFCAFANLGVMKLAEASTKNTAEPLHVMTLSEALTSEGSGVLPNVPWLVAMALAKLRGESAERFVVREEGAKPRDDKARAGQPADLIK